MKATGMGTERPLRLDSADGEPWEPRDQQEICVLTTWAVGEGLY